MINVTDYDNTTCDYKIITNNCVINENIIDIIIPTLLLTVSCGPSFLCLMILVVYTIMKAFLKFK